MTIKIYVCCKDVYEATLKIETKTGLVFLFPEIEILSSNWLEQYSRMFLNKNPLLHITVVTQSADLLKFLEAYDVNCEVSVYNSESNLFKKQSVLDARIYLLETYEKLMIKNYLKGL